MRQDQWSNTVMIDGVPLGVWDTFDGGGADSEETKYRPGGMKPEISLGGARMLTNMTLSRLLEQEDWDTMRGLMNKTGKAQCTVSRQPLDIDGNPWGRPLTYRGTLKAVTPTGSDSNSSNAHTWEIEISTEGNVA